MASDLSTAIPIFNLKYNLAKTIKSKNSVSQTLKYKNKLPVASQTVSVSNTYCDTVKIKNLIISQSTQKIIQKPESDKNISRFSALGPSASPPTNHGHHTHLVATTPLNKIKNSPKQINKKKWEYLEKYYTDYFGADEKTPPSCEGKHNLCKIYFLFKNAILSATPPFW